MAAGIGASHQVGDCYFLALHWRFNFCYGCFAVLILAACFNVKQGVKVARGGRRVSLVVFTARIIVEYQVV
jgi:hypothetical protein